MGSHNPHLLGASVPVGILLDIWLWYHLQQLELSTSRYCPLWLVAYHHQAHSFETCMLERGFHTPVRNVWFSSSTDVGSHKLLQMVSKPDIANEDGNEIQTFLIKWYLKRYLKRCLWLWCSHVTIWLKKKEFKFMHMECGAWMGKTSQFIYLFIYLFSFSKTF